MNRIDLLRDEMKKEGIDIYLVPTSDPHQSEYLSEHWKGREWLSGFTGSAGMLIVTESEAGLWTDGRYFIQAEKELKDTGIKLYKMGIPGEETVYNFIRKKLGKGGVLGLFGRDLSIAQYQYLLKGSRNIRIKTDIDLVDRIWKDRPSKPVSELFIHEERFTGESTGSKLARLRAHMSRFKLDKKIVSSLDEIAWLFNLRGRDIKNNPVFISFAIISQERAVLFTDAIVNEKVKNYSEEQFFEIKKLDEFEMELKGIESECVSLDPEKSSLWIKNSLELNKIVFGRDILTYYESIRNEIQIDNLRETYRRDGAAVIKLLNWIKKSLKSGEEVSEIDISDKLIELRSEIDNFIEPSFDTIAAYKEHGAMMHYSADEESNYILEEDGLLLIDSGGQYLSGTTDITRTISLGNVTEDEKKHYTLTLKGMINLTNAKFLDGTKGIALDIFAREYLWKEGIDYKSGTGHGVGYCLSVHLGDQRISPRAVDSVLKPGMTVTNEPGVYLEGKYGIRIENVLLVKEYMENESDKFLEFETLTLCPFDKELIDFSLLTEEEIEWIDEYNKKMREELEDLLTEEEMELIW